MIITKAPFRVSFLGGGSDLPEYFERKTGKVLGCTIQQYTYLSLFDLRKFFNYSIKLVYSKIETVSEPGQLEHPSVRAVLSRYGMGGIEIHNWADLPALSGMGSSSSFAVALLHAVRTFKGLGATPHELASEAYEIERHVLGEYGGAQDQFHAAYGGLNTMEFSKSGVRVTPVPIRSEMQEALESQCLLFFTGLVRSASEIHKSHVTHTREEKNDVYLDKLVSLVSEGEQLLMSPHDATRAVTQFGELLHQGWELKQSLSKNISASRIDEMVATARSAGASGSKLLGAGGGGFMLFIVPDPACAARLREKFAGLVEVPFRLCSEGSRVILSERG